MRKISILILLCLIYIVTFPQPVNATMIGLDTTEMPDTDKTATIEKIDLMLIQDESYKGSIACFDVKENGTYALAFDLGTNSIIHIYNSNNAFLYGFRFQSDGDYGIEFYGDDLAIYFLRGNKIAVYNNAGECTDVRKVDTTSKRYIHHKEILNRYEKHIAEKRYALERDIDLGDSYSRFVVENILGERTVLYDCSNEHGLEQILFIIPIGFFIFVVWGVYQKIKTGEDAPS